jgi:site-specific DNA recombinase
MVKVGEVNRIVVYHADRLYRRPRELEDLVELADQGRVQIVSVYSGELDLGTSDGRMVARMLIAVASKESEDKARRVKRAKAEAREKGRPMGGPRPFGWRDAETPEPKEAKLIDQAVARLLAGGSLADIARRWNAAGISQPQTGRANWTPDIVHQVVSNPRHAALVGHRVPMGGQRWARPVVVGPAVWQPIIDRARWEQLQALLVQRGLGSRVPRRRSLLTGLVICGRCGSVMSRSGSRGKNGDGTVRRVWRCPHQTGCGSVSIDADGLEGLLTEATFRRADTATLAKIVRQQGRQGKEAAGLVGKIEELTARENAAAESYAAGRLAPRAFERASTAIQREQRAVQLRLSQLTATTALEPFAGRPGVLRSAWPTLSIDQRRAIIGIVLGRVTVERATHPGRIFDTDRVKIDGKSRVS